MRKKKGRRKCRLFSIKSFRIASLIVFVLFEDAVLVSFRQKDMYVLCIFISWKFEFLFDLVLLGLLLLSVD